ncbi:hypothetical protein ACOSP7_008027 [Xanthoceras sorbifolium]
MICEDYLLASGHGLCIVDKAIIDLDTLEYFGIDQGFRAEHATAQMDIGNGVPCGTQVVYSHLINRYPIWKKIQHALCDHDILL